MFQSVCEGVAVEFVEQPVDFTVEYEVQARLYERLRAELAERDSLHTTAEEVSLVGTKTGYKQAYWETVEAKWQDNGGLTRVHPEVTVTKGERIDLAVLTETVERVGWHNGSKRFEESDLAAAFEVKYVKNKSRFPTTEGVNELRKMDEDRLRSALDTTENGLQGDFEELGRLPDDVRTFLVLYSNKNYLYSEPLSPRERRHEPVYESIGREARKWLRQAGAETNTAVLYVTPRKYEWITGP